jgi:hypothetical protein
MGSVSTSDMRADRLVVIELTGNFHREGFTYALRSLCSETSDSLIKIIYVATKLFLSSLHFGLWLAFLGSKARRRIVAEEFKIIETMIAFMKSQTSSSG